MDGTLSDRARAVLAACNETQGRLREPDGGGAVDVDGAHAWSSGLPYRQWNGADITAPDRVDVGALRAWFAARAVPWGVRVAAGTPWAHGRFALHQRVMVLDRSDYRGPYPQLAISAGVTLRAAVPDDAPDLAAVDAVSFSAEPEPSLEWLSPQLGSPLIDTVVAVDVRDPAAPEVVGLATGVPGRPTDGHPAGVGIFGVGVLPSFRRRGIGGALTAAVLDLGFARGAETAVLSPDTEDAARIYARLGFVEVPGYDIYVDL